MKGLLSILLIADRHTSSLEAIRQVAALADAHADEHDLMIVANGCTPDVYSDITCLLAGMENAKVIKLVAETDPDSAIMEGLQRAIGDVVFIGSVRDLAIESLPAMLEMAQSGHEVVLALPRVGGTILPDKRLDYGSRLMSRAAVHYVVHAGSVQKSAYYLLPGNPLFVPATVVYDAKTKPRENLVRSIRRRWRAMLSSRIAPLRLVSALALFGALANIAYSVYVVGYYLLHEGVAPGWATLSLQSSGMNLLFSLALFVLCEYLVNVFRASQIDQQVRVECEIRSRTVSYDRANLERA